MDFVKVEGGKLQLDQSKAIIFLSLLQYFLAVFYSSRIISLDSLSRDLPSIVITTLWKKCLCQLSMKQVQRNMIGDWQTYRNPAFFTNESIRFYVNKIWG